MSNSDLIPALGRGFSEPEVLSGALEGGAWRAAPSAQAAVKAAPSAGVAPPGILLPGPTAAAPELQLASFDTWTIPAFSTLQDFNLADFELEDPFAELADESKLGYLPTEAELKAQLFHLPQALQGPPPQPPAPPAQLALPWPALPSLNVGASAPRRQPSVLRTQSVEGSPRFRRQSSLGSLKRGLDALGLEQEEEQPGSARRAVARDGDDSSPRSVVVAGSPARRAGQSRRSVLPSRFRTEAAGAKARGRWGGSSGDDEEFEPGAEEEEEEADSSEAEAESRGGRQRRAGREEGEEPALPSVVYRGVSRHRLTHRWEASLWLQGRQLYLGGFNSQEEAAHAYDLAALACKGPGAPVNFPEAGYAEQLAEVAGLPREEVVAYVRRRSAAFSRGRSHYRGVSGHNGRWEARIGSYGGRKNVSFGVYDSEEEAARQYDRALVVEKGRSAKTNFPISSYDAEVLRYEEHLMRTCGAVQGPAVAEEAAAYTLPRNRTASADEKKKGGSAVIYAESLRKALRQAPGRKH